MASLESVEVVQSDRAPNSFQLVFTTPRGPSEVRDYGALSLKTGQRIIITGAVNSTSRVLIDGFVTRVQLQAPGPSQEARITIIGEDLSVMMDMYEYSVEYPCLPDSAIVEVMLSKWLWLGVVPNVAVSLTDLVNMFYVNQQVGTDRAYINQLATQNAYVFCIIPGPTVGTSTAYWGPPIRTAPPQPALTIDAGGFGNVVSLSATFDGVATQAVYGFVQDTLTGDPLPAGSAFSTRSGTLAENPTLPVASFQSARRFAQQGFNTLQADMRPKAIVNTATDQVATLTGRLDALRHGSIRNALAGMPGLPSSFFQPVRLFDHQGLNILQAEMRAQAIVNASTDQVATLTGRLDALRYGSILTAPGVVPVRGVGYSFDGYYYVQKVVHSVSRGAYIQEFALAREGLGSTVATLPPGQVSA